MNKQKEGKGVITVLANGINGLTNLDNIKEGIAFANDINARVSEAQMRLEIEKRSQKIEGPSKPKIDPVKLGEEAKAFIENNAMERE